MAEPVSRFQKVRASIKSLLDESMFRSPDEPSRIYKFIHFWVLVARSFVRNRCPIRASALSFTTLLALIPVLALVMSVTTSMLKKEGKEQIEQFIDNFVSTVVPPGVMATNEPPIMTDSEDDTPPVQNELAGTETNSLSMTNLVAGGPGSTNAAAASTKGDMVNARKHAAAQIYSFVQNAQSGAITGIGAVLLILVAIRMVRSIEATLNDIWGVTRGRGWGLSIALYWTTVTLGPVLLACAVGLASGPHFKGTRDFLITHGFIGGLAFKLLPLLVLWLAFALFYKGIPNTKVRFNAALVGGIVGGTIWHVNNMFGFLYVSRVVSSSRIYGSLGLIPVFMAGIYFSWLIFLFGAQVAYAFQNRALYLQEKLAEHVNQRGREFVALRLMTCIGQRFQRGLPPATIDGMSCELGIPSRLVQQVLHTLIAARLVMEISGAESAYTPARPLDSINAHHVLMAMRATQGQELVTRDEPVRAEVYGEFARIQEAEKEVASRVTLLALVNRAEARLQIAPPAPAVKEIKLTPALVPSVASAAPKPECAPVKLEKKPEPEVNPPTELIVASLEPDVTASQEHPPVRPVVEPTTDEERQFPL